MFAPRNPRWDRADWIVLGMLLAVTLVLLPGLALLPALGWIGVVGSLLCAMFIAKAWLAAWRWWRAVP